MPTYVVTTHFWQIIDHWQTLIAGGAAVVAASITTIVLVIQIRQTGKLAADQRQRRARGAHAVLPLALSELADYSIACVKGLYNLQQYFRADGSLDRSRAEEAFAAWTSPTLPENVLAILKECIEFVGDNPAMATEKLIRHLQIQKTRLGENISKIRLNDEAHLITRHNIDQATRDSAEIYGRIMPLFVFARGQKIDDFEVNRDWIRDALSLSGCFRDYDEIELCVNMWEKEFSFKQKLQKNDSKSIAL